AGCRIRRGGGPPPPAGGAWGRPPRRAPRSRDTTPPPPPPAAFVLFASTTNGRVVPSVARARRAGALGGPLMWGGLARDRARGGGGRTGGGGGVDGGRGKKPPAESGRAEAEWVGPGENAKARCVGGGVGTAPRHYSARGTAGIAVVISPRNSAWCGRHRCARI